MLKKLLLFPFGGTAREVLSTILSSSQLQSQWEVVGFLDDQEDLIGRECCGVKVIGTRHSLKTLKDVYLLAVPAHPQSFLKRKEIIDSLGVRPARFATIIHPSTVVAQDAKIGFNTFIALNGFVSSQAVVGNHCVVLSNTVISHDVRIEDYCCVGANVTISGTVSIKRCSYVGSAVSIKENIQVGEGCLIGIGANVVKDVAPRTVVVGNPAKLI